MLCQVKRVQTAEVLVLCMKCILNQLQGVVGQVIINLLLTVAKVVDMWNGNLKNKGDEMSRWTDSDKWSSREKFIGKKDEQTMGEWFWGKPPVKKPNNPFYEL